MPHRAAGWRIDPPVSVPIPSGAWPAATAAADPPLEPPGTRVGSQGLRVVPNPEFSVEEPMANSSMLVLPRITTPASRSRRTTVASYGGTNSSRIFDPAVDRTPLVTSTSLRARGTPASGPSRSPRSLAWSNSRAASRAWAPAAGGAAARGWESAGPPAGGGEPLQGGLGGLDGGRLPAGEALGQLVGGQVGQ